MWFLLPLLAVGGLVAAFAFGRDARAADVATRGPQSSKLPENAKSVTGDSGTPYLVALVSVEGDVQIFDVWLPTKVGPFWVLRYAHNRETRARMLLGTVRAKDLLAQMTKADTKGLSEELADVERAIARAKADFI